MLIIHANLLGKRQSADGYGNGWVIRPCQFCANSVPYIDLTEVPSKRIFSSITRSGTAISKTRFFGSLDFPTRRFARTLKNTRQSKQIKTHPSTTDLQAITTNRLGNFCRLALQEASILMDTPKGHIFSPPRPPKRAEATAFSPSRHEKETSNETPEHPRYRENKDNDDEEDNQGVPPASSDLTSPRVLKYRREYNEEDGFAAEQAQARKYLHHDICVPTFAVPLPFHLILMKMIHSQR